LPTPFALPYSLLTGLLSSTLYLFFSANLQEESAGSLANAIMADFAMPDLSNLTEEERRQIEDVINRQKHEEAKDKEVVQ
jgi:hypothetical protein